VAIVAVIGNITVSLVGFRGPLLAAMKAAGHRVVAFGVERDAATEAQLAAMGVEFRTWRCRRAGLNPALDLIALADLARQLRAVRADVVLGYTMKPVVYGSIAAKLAGVGRSYSMITGLGYAFIGSGRKARLTGAVLGRLLQLAFRTNERVLVYNRDIEEAFRARGLFRDDAQVARVGGTGVDLSGFPPAPLPEGPPTFLLIARLLADKGVREYAAAAKALKARHPGARFVLVGPYDPNPTALQPVEVEGWVREGWIEHPGATRDVRPYLRACAVYVLPSYAEGVPRTVQEAMSTGRAIVTTDAPGCRDTVEEGVNGFLVPPRDADALAAAMERFLVDPSLAERMGRASRALCEERFDVHAINRTVLALTGLDR
jgi:glycosyltransferase involved in cell wall biosynthesis